MTRADDGGAVICGSLSRTVMIRFPSGKISLIDGKLVLGCKECQKTVISLFFKQPLDEEANDIVPSG